MTLPSSGPLSIGDIAGEFGGSVPHSLSEYYGAAAGVPSTGPLDISDFYGKSAVGPVQYVGVRTSKRYGTGNLNLTMPSGWQVGDVAIVTGCCKNTGQSPSIATAGWTNLSSSARQVYKRKTLTASDGVVTVSANYGQLFADVTVFRGGVAGQFKTEFISSGTPNAPSSSCADGAMMWAHLHNVTGSAVLGVPSGFTRRSTNNSASQGGTSVGTLGNLSAPSYNPGAWASAGADERRWCTFVINPA